MVSRFEKFSASIFTVFRYVQHLETEEMEKYGMKGSFAQYLLVMERCPEGITAAKLGKLCDKDKAAVSRALTEMQEKGLVRRVENGGSYRAPLTLTEQGKAAAEFVQQRAKIAVEAAGAGLDEENRRIMYESLDLIAANLKRICEEGSPQ